MNVRCWWSTYVSHAVYKSSRKVPTYLDRMSVFRQSIPVSKCELD